MSLGVSVSVSLSVSVGVRVRARLSGHLCDAMRVVGRRREGDRKVAPAYTCNCMRTRVPVNSTYMQDAKGVITEEVSGKESWKIRKGGQKGTCLLETEVFGL
jgi:hypothetical protein